MTAEEGTFAIQRQWDAGGEQRARRRADAAYLARTVNFFLAGIGINLFVSTIHPLIYHAFSHWLNYGPYQEMDYRVIYPTYLYLFLRIAALGLIFWGTLRAGRLVVGRIRGFYPAAAIGFGALYIAATFLVIVSNSGGGNRFFIYSLMLVPLLGFASYPKIALQVTRQQDLKPVRKQQILFLTVAGIAVWAGVWMVHFLVPPGAWLRSLGVEFGVVWQSGLFMALYSVRRELLGKESGTSGLRPIVIYVICTSLAAGLGLYTVFKARWHPEVFVTAVTVGFVCHYRKKVLAHPVTALTGWLIMGIAYVITMLNPGAIEFAFYVGRYACTLGAVVHIIGFAAGLWYVATHWKSREKQTALMITGLVLNLGFLAFAIGILSGKLIVYI